MACLFETAEPSISQNLPKTKKVELTQLAQIVQLVTLLRAKKIPLSSFLSENTIIKKLFIAVQEGNYRSDDELAQHFFQSDASDRRYITLKSKLMQQVRRMLLFLDLDTLGVHKYTRNRYWCHKKLICLKLLVRYGKWEGAMLLARRLLLKARQFHLMDVTVACLQILRQRAALNCNEHSFELYNRQLEEALVIRREEIQAAALVENIFVNYSRAAAPPINLYSDAVSHCLKLNTLRRKYNTRTLNLYYFRLKILAAELAFDYEATLAICDELESYLNGNPHLNSNSRIAELLLTRLYCCLFLRQFDLGRQFATNGLRLFQRRDFNWFSCLETYFLLELHDQNYAKAAVLYKNAMQSIDLLKAYPQRIEKWRIFEAYLRFALPTLDSRVNACDNKTYQTKFNIYKFLNDVPIYAKDKRGFNVTILIAHMLHLIRNRDIDGLLSKTSALEVYNSKYLRQEVYLRSNCFIRLILTVVYKEFDVDEIQKRAEIHLQRLSRSKPNFASRAGVIEVIPYEQLWQLLVCELKAFSRNEVYACKNGKSAAAEAGITNPESSCE